MRGGCNIQNMPFKDNNSVDIVVCTETLEHVPISLEKHKKRKRELLKESVNKYRRGRKKWKCL